MGSRDYIVMPERWLASGEALVRGARRSLLVWGGIPGERAEVHVFDEGAHQDRGRFKALAGEAHPSRRAPPCDRYEVCGACPLMHVTAESAQAARLGLVSDALAEVGLASASPTRLITGPDGERGFRHALRLRVGLSDQGHIRVGTLDRAGQRIVPIPDCLVTTRPLRDAMAAAAHHVIELNLGPWEPGRERGVLRRILLRQSRATGDILVTLVAGRKLPLLWDLAERLASGQAAIVGVHLHVNDDPGPGLFAPDGDGLVETWRLNGKDFIEDLVGDVRVRVGPGDRFPDNPGAFGGLVTELREALARDAHRPLVDLGCGVGALTLGVGRAHPFRLGVEHSASEIERARDNATAAHLAAEFLASPLELALPDVRRRLAGTAPVVLVSAGRRPLDPELLAGVFELAPSRLVVRAADPRALARTLSDLVARDWSVDRVLAVDVSPQTADVELVALASPPGPAAAERRPPRRKVLRG